MTEKAKPFLPKHKRPERSSFDAVASWREAAVEAATANMKEFIAHVRKQSWFLQRNNSPRWDDLIWRLNVDWRLDNKHYVSFVSRPRSKEPLPEPFAEQSRGIAAQIHLWKPGMSMSSTMRVLRLILDAMRSSGQTPDLTRLGQHVIDNVHATISEDVHKGSRWLLGRQLEIIVNDILFDRGLTVDPVSYNSPFKFTDGHKPKNYIILSDKSAQEESETQFSKLPDLQAVFALAELFHKPGDRFRNPNLVVSSFAALALFAPSRVSEILTLPVDCIRVADDNGKQSMGLKWRPAKGGEPMTKFAVTPEWEELASEAIRRLTVLGNGARAAAAWYERNPDRLYLPPGMEHKRGKPLTILDIAMIIGYEPGCGPGFLTAHTMLNSLERSGQEHSNEKPLFSQESVKTFVRQHIKDYPGYLPERLSDLAEWLEKENSDLAMEGELKVASAQALTIAQCLSIIGLSENDLEYPDSLKSIARALKVTGGKAGSPMDWRRQTYEFASFERWVLKRLQKKMPVVDEHTELNYSAALFCLPRNILEACSETYWNIPFWISPTRIRGALNGSGHYRSIFEKNGIIDPETGNPRRLKPHEFRHLLNTLAQNEHLGQQIIAFWSGRKDVRQNQAYSHRRQEFALESWQRLIDDSADNVKLLESIHDREVNISVEDVLSYQQAQEMELGAVQISRHGICRHIFALSPCQFEMDCVNCNENMFVAHDPKLINEAENQIRLLEKSLYECHQAAESGQSGTELWIKHHSEKLRRWQAALELMTDPNTPPGRIVNLPENPNVKTTAEFAMLSSASINHETGNE